ncbi:MAG: arginyltransferase [Acidobacteriota bacterium]
MLQVIREKIGDEESCPYLPGVQARMHYRLVDRCLPRTYQQMLERGWRRFGRVFFRPICAACNECRSLRLEVADFRPNRSMRRTLKHNQDLTVLLRPVSLSREHLDLYNRYHHDMEQRKDWPGKSITADDYFQTFVEGREGYGHELLCLEENRLIAVALVDLLPDALSAVYCYYDPERRSRSLGSFSILQQIELARSRGASRVYLGYWIANNPSMRYKARYRPHQILQGWPELDEEPIWREI